MASEGQFNESATALHIARIDQTILYQ